METNHFLTISLLLTLGLALCTNTGCKRIDPGRQNESSDNDKAD